VGKPLFGCLPGCCRQQSLHTSKGCVNPAQSSSPAVTAGSAQHCPLALPDFASPLTQRAHLPHASAADCNAGLKAIARGDEVAMQTNRFNPTDPFTATDPAPKYNSRDPKTGEPSVEIEITMSRK